jgi:hypothetical protein
MRDNKQDLKINTLENNYKAMGEKIDRLEEAVVNGFNELKAEFKCMRAENDQRYASKLTEQIVYGLVGLILLAFAGGVVTLVLR